MSACLTIAWKEITDHSRDGRSLRAAALYALMGPAVILLVSQSAAAARGGAALLLSMMSVFALVAAFTGGMYVALDSTAGERERGSMAPLLLNPIPRLHVVVGKWLGVSAFALAGLALTMAGFTAVFEWGGIEPPAGLTGVLILWMVCGLVPLALLGAALNLLTGATSRSLKDAQARLSFAMFVPMVVGMCLVFFPEWISRWWFAIPVLGQQVIIGAGLRGESVSVLQAAMLGVITLATAAAAILLTAREMNRDDFVAG